MALTSGSKILVSDVKGAVKGFSVSGKTVTFTKLDGTTGTFTTQDTTSYPQAVVKNCGDYDRGSWTLPSGGTWAVLYWDTNISDFHGISTYASGGTTFGAGTYLNGMAIRIS